VAEMVKAILKVKPQVVKSCTYNNPNRKKKWWNN
jgi:hypothetical protein